MPRKETATFATTTMIVHSGRLEALTGKMPVAIIQAVVINDLWQKACGYEGSYGFDRDAGPGILITQCNANIA
jgi:hypothetical protein